MLVDNAIVVLENINRHLAERAEDSATSPAASHAERGASASARGRAAQGTREMARPVIAATLTTIAVFFPVVYVPGIAGAFFRDQALTVTFSLLVSVAVALLLQPVLVGARAADRRSGRRAGSFRLFDAVFERRPRASTTGSWSRALRRPVLDARAARDRRWPAPACSGHPSSSAASCPSAAGDMRLDLELPAGTPLEETDATVGATWPTGSRTSRGADGVHPGRDAPSGPWPRCRTTPPRTPRACASSSNQDAGACARGPAAPGRDRRAAGPALTERAATPSARRASAWARSSSAAAARRSPWAWWPRIRCEAVAGGRTICRRRFAEVDGLADLQVDRVLGTPNVVVRLDREEILRSGLDPERLARELRDRIAGVEATTFNEVEQRIDIAVRFAARRSARIWPRRSSSPVRLAGGRTRPAGHLPGAAARSARCASWCAATSDAWSPSPATCAADRSTTSGATPGACRRRWACPAVDAGDRGGRARRR